MACTLNNGLQIDLCNSNQGGVLKLYIQNYDERTFTYGAGASASLITAISGATPSFYTHELPRQSSSYTSTSTTDDITGTTVYDETGEFIVHSVNTATLERLKSLSKGKFRLIFYDNNGKYIMFGKERGVRINVAVTSGKADNEMNGATLTIVGREKELPYEVSASLVASIATV